MLYELELDRIKRQMVRNGFSDSDLQQFEDAFRFAERKLHGKFLGNSKPIFYHNIEMTKYLMGMSADLATAIASIIHNVVNYDTSYKEVEEVFGQEVARLVEDRVRLKRGVRKEIEEGAFEAAEDLFIIMTKDVRVVLLELVDRVCLFRHYDELEDELKETQLVEGEEVYVPLAAKLGCYNIQTEIENIILKNRKPKVFQELNAQIEKSKYVRNKRIDNFRSILKRKIESAGINAEFVGRLKNVASIYNKMARLGKRFEEIYDINAVRVITDSVEDCYRILGVVHSNWKPLPGEFDDYIAKPKSNGYRSLHTTVIGPENRPIEVQIRTGEMHNFAEFGAASHWRYKGFRKKSKHDKRLGWVKQALQWKSNPQLRKLSESLKVDVGDEIFVLTPKNEIIELPEGSTVLDFAYAVHSEVGNKCSRAKVNGVIVPLKKVLSNGDSVEIITSPKQIPKRVWLSVVKTDKAVQRIRQALELPSLKRKSRDKNKEGRVVSTSEKRVRFASCCMPEQGDDILGALTTKRKISVHKRDCPELKKIPAGQAVEVEWAGQMSNGYKYGFKVTASDRVGLLSDLLRVISERELNILSTNVKTAGNFTNCFFEIETKRGVEIDEIISKIREVKGVNKVNRV